MRSVPQLLREADSDADCNRNCDCNANRNGDCNCNADSYSHCNGDGDGNCHRDGDGDGNCNGDTDRHADLFVLGFGDGARRAQPGLGRIGDALCGGNGLRRECYRLGERNH